MLLSDLLKSESKNYKKIFVNNICFDSRKIKKNDVFFSISGNSESGHKFIKDAVSAGASAIITDKKIKNKSYKIPLIKVNNVRKILSKACSKFYKIKPKNIIAITGTNGKSSVADFFYQILKFNKVKAATIGTLGIKSLDYNKKTKLTSLDPLTLHKNLEILKKRKINNVILEASSHGLDQKRLDYLNIKIGIFTNFSHDHLDYHKSMKSYFNSKMHLFKDLLNKKSIIITDEDNSKFKTIKKISNTRKIKIFTIGETSKNLQILEHEYFKDKQIIKIFFNSKIYLFKVSLIGFFQIKNLLMSIMAAFRCGINEKEIFRSIAKIKAVPGRLECVANLNNNSQIIIDFAHTPEALEKSLIALKKQFKKEILIVFGCGGERDKKKRFTMGKIAKLYCRKVFVTDDNPRNENPKKIRDSIIAGCKIKAINIGNRKKAIKTAINELNQNEILLVAGKGHERTQDYGNRVVNFSDKKVIKEIVKKKNFLLKKAFKKNNFKNINYKGVSINTKTIKKNELFFAISGKKNDGHEYLNEAIKKGAIKTVVSKKVKLPKNKIIRVKNTLLSLNNLAKETRYNTSARIVGITGSVGKTTLKNLIGFALKNYGKVYHSPYSYNNKFGVPLSISNLKKDTKYGIFEIGMDKKGEIDNLSKIVKPEIAIITNISGAHFKNFNSLKDIAKAKSEIIDNIIDSGKIILNKDDKFFNFLSNKALKKEIKVISFSSKKKADIYLSGVKKIKNIYKLKIIIKKNIFYFYTKIATNNFISNFLACVATLNTLNLNIKNLEKKFMNFSLPSGRGDVKIIKKFNKKFKLIDESYNASPLSMKSAIENINNYKKNKNAQKIIFLGDMLELGKKSKKFHKKLSTIINKSNVDKVYVYGKDIKKTFYSLYANKKGKIFNNLTEAYEHFSKIVHNNDLVMIKGSNATGLNRFSKKIKKGQISAL